MINISLIGNPNVGKSSIFNLLTKSHQHTGNWTGKTVGSNASVFSCKDKDYKIYDLPGTYSLISHSLEEEITRDFIYNNKDNFINRVAEKEKEFDHIEFDNKLEEKDVRRKLSVGTVLNEMLEEYRKLTN